MSAIWTFLLISKVRGNGFLRRYRVVSLAGTTFLLATKAGPLHTRRYDVGRWMECDRLHDARDMQFVCIYVKLGGRKCVARGLRDECERMSRDFSSAVNKASIQRSIN